MAPYDIFGNIALIKFPRGTKRTEKKRYGERFLKEHRGVSTVLEKSDKIKGRLRTPTSVWVSGVKTKEALYKENGCEFRLHVDSCYFSPRLSSERKELASQVKKGERVLVMFGGVAPFAIVIAKHSKAKEVVSVELGRVPHRYAQQNVKRNKVSVDLVQGDVRRVVPRISGMFDRIVMARPNLKDSFLDIAFKKIQKGTIHYYGFYHEDDLAELKSLILEEAQRAHKKIKIIRVQQAGNIGARKYRYRADIRVL